MVIDNIGDIFTKIVLYLHHATSFYLSVWATTYLDVAWRHHDSSACGEAVVKPSGSSVTPDSWEFLGAERTKHLSDWREIRGSHLARFNCDYGTTIVFNILRGNNWISYNRRNKVLKLKTKKSIYVNPTTTSITSFTARATIRRGLRNTFCPSLRQKKPS